MTICFRNRVGERPLECPTAVYVNPFGEPFRIEQCKYYVSGIRVRDLEGKQELLAPGVHLVDQADTVSLTLRLSCGLMRLRSIAFVVGVDSAINTGAVMTGDLDPLHGMFWTWNSGFIYARLEGRSDSARSPAHRFSWDIGGYRANANAAREIVLAIPDRWGGGEPGGREGVEPGGPGDGEVLVIEADLLKWFDGKTAVRLSASPACHEPGVLAMQIADNYSTMFSIGH